MSWLGRIRADRQIARMTDPAAGTLHVTSATYPPAGESVMYSNYHLAGVVQAPGLKPTAVEHSGIARVAKWPQPGSDLPVSVDRARPDRLVIHWEQLLTSRDAALAAAQAEANQMRTGLDPAVLADAVKQTAAGTAPDWVADLASGGDPARRAAPAPPAAPPPPPPAAPSGPLRHELPPSTATVAATGRVVALREVGVPAALVPAGGVVDMTVAISEPSGGERTAVCRASFATPEERSRVAAVGAIVGLLVDPDDPDVITLSAG